MFLRFFISHYDDGDFTIHGTAAGSRQSAASHNQYKVESNPTFERLKSGLARRMNRTSQYQTNDNFTREILINVEDASMFQLEALCVAEYSYCSFNLETLKIGFGNTPYNAYRATWSGDIRNRVNFSSGSANAEKDYMLNFYPESKKKEASFIYTCPDNFYSQVLEELRPYIAFEKNYMFKEVTDVLERETTFLDSFLDNFGVSDRDDSKYNGTTLVYNATCSTIDMFMNDDPDILANSEMHTSGFRFLGALCLKMMQLSDETF